MADLQQRRSPWRLLQLPGELRNKIYRYAITRSSAANSIDVTIQGMPEPALLRTCKQIRDETVSIYYCENYFRCIAAGCNPKAQMIVEQRLVAIDRSHQVELLQLKPIPLRLQPPHNWCNLKAWAQHIHSRKMGVLRDMEAVRSPPIAVKPCAGIHAAENVLIRSIFDLALGLRGTPWTVVEGFLETTHAALITLEARWA